LKTKLFCIPYAGGSAIIFRQWYKYLDRHIELIPLELQGRGERIAEPLCGDVDGLVADIFERVLPHIQEIGSYSIFGHSMGAMLTYELARKLRQEGLPSPAHLIFSGRGAPDLKPKREKRYDAMDDEEFERELMLLGGTPPEIFENPEMRTLFLPILRNDFNLAGTDFSDRPIEAFHCDISVLIGQEEKLTDEHILAWKKHTTGICSIHFFNGGHFFIKSQEVKVVKMINKILTPIIEKRRIVVP